MVCLAHLKIDPGRVEHNFGRKALDVWVVQRGRARHNLQPPPGSALLRHAKQTAVVSRGYSVPALRVRIG